MKSFNLRNSLVCFSDISDGDLSFYNFDEAEQIERWEGLEPVSEFNLRAPAFLTQVHGERLFRINSSDDLSELEGDGLFTRELGLPVGVFSADCLPIIFASDRGIGAVHAGWRGTLRGISGKGAQRMTQFFQCKIKEVYAFLGPCINQCCLELGEEIYRDFIQADPNYGAFFEQKEKWYLDLRGLNRFQLVRAGILNRNIIDINRCTFCEEDNYFSFRRQRKRNGSMFSFVVLKDESMKELKKTKISDD
jgi:YfiH family protein